jgi:ribosomal protein S18 acetylase RimI-like enzyme/predicted nucleic acid-binding protein
MESPPHSQITSPRVIEVDPETKLLGDVVELANGPAKRTLGFLPDEGFAERARKGNLLAAIEGESLLGYVLFDLPGRDVKIVHLCVSPQARCRGVARALVEDLSRRHADRIRLVLSCRHDYDATAVWEALGFRPQGSRPGRSLEGHFLTIWVKDFGHPTLFDDVADDRQRVALDHNVFLDLHLDPLQRVGAPESRYLLDDWIAEYVELCITDEILHEIHRLTDGVQRQAEQRWASGYRNLSTPSTVWADLQKIVAAQAPRAGERDHRHVARAAAGGADYFVSRDDDLLAAASAIAEQLSIQVVRPAALIARLDEMRSDSPYRPAALQGTALRQFTPPGHLHDDVIATLLNHGAGERLAELRMRLRPALADTEGHEVRIVQTPQGRTVGGFVRRPCEDRIEVPLLRVISGWDGAHAMARQLVFAQRQSAADRGASRVVITDPCLSRECLAALSAESFEQEGDGWSCHVQRGVVDAREMFPHDRVEPVEAAALEAQRWPLKVSGTGISTYAVAIKVAFAEALLDPALAAQTLLPRQVGLGLNREHVYYRSPANSRGIARGSRIVWYVTGDSPVHSRGAIRAISQVADVVVGRPRSLFARFERFGVYNVEQVCGEADRNGKVMAIRFSDTEVLERPLGLDELSQLWSGQGERFLAPQSPTRISEHMFCLLYRRSSRYGA